MKQYLSGILALACLLGLAACGGRGAPEGAEDISIPEDMFSVDVLCEDMSVDQIAYAAYAGGAFRTMGGEAILDRDPSEKENLFTLRFSLDDFEEGDDLAEFSIALSPVRPGDKVDPKLAEPVAIPAELGKAYTVLLSGSSDSGFTAELE